MISKEDVKKLADLARIEIEDGEIDGLSDEMDAILSYVGQVKSVAATLEFDGIEGDQIHNVMREDESPTESKTHSDILIAEFPQKQGDYLKVKKIL